MRTMRIGLICLGALALWAQDSTPPAKVYHLDAGTRIPLTVMKSVSTKTAVPGDPIYLETVFPVVASGKIVIPRGSYVSGSVTGVQRAGKVKGRAELRVRLESLILPDGTTRDFRGTIGGIDAQDGQKLDGEGAIQGKGNKAGDVRNVMTGAGYGAMAGAAAGGLATIGTSGTETVTTSNGTQVVQTAASAVRRPIIGSSIGMVAGAAAVFTATLFMRGPDAVLAKGSDVDMVLDSPVTFEETGGVVPAQPNAENQRGEAGLKRR